MDFWPNEQNLNQSNEYQNRPPVRPGNMMELAACILGYVAIATTCCIYLSLVCGGLAVILGLLSRGKNKKLPDRARIAVTTGAVAMIATVCMTAFMFVTTIRQYGSFDNFMKTYMETVEQLSPGLETNTDGI